MEERITRLRISICMVVTAAIVLILYCDNAIANSDKEIKAEMSRRDSLKLACDKGEALGCYYQGVFEERQDNKGEAQRLYKFACDKGLAGACVGLGVLEYEQGNKGEAMRLFKLACNMGEALGCNSLKKLFSR